MKRRGFLGLLGAAVAAPFVPTPEPPVLVPHVGIDLASQPDTAVVTRYTHDSMRGNFIDVTSWNDRYRTYIPGPRG